MRFGVTKADIHGAARKCGRAINSEIVIRLLLAAGSVQTTGEINPHTASGQIEVDIA